MSTEPLYFDGVNAELLEQCMNNDQQAFKEIYHLYSKAMFNICYRMLNNKDDAADVLQESFIAAFKSIKQYSGKSSFGAWLKRIVINHSIDFLKKRNLNLIALEDSEFLMEENYEEEEDMEYNVDKIRKAIGLLADGYRVIITLYLFEDYTHKMIAEKLGISEGTSKSQYSRARKKLLELMIHTKRNS